MEAESWPPRQRCPHWLRTPTPFPSRTLLGGAPQVGEGTNQQAGAEAVEAPGGAAARARRVGGRLDLFPQRANPEHATLSRDQGGGSVPSGKLHDPGTRQPPEVRQLGVGRRAPEDGGVRWEPGEGLVPPQSPEWRWSASSGGERSGEPRRPTPWERRGGSPGGVKPQEPNPPTQEVDLQEQRDPQQGEPIGLHHRGQPNLTLVREADPPSHLRAPPTRRERA